MTTLGKLLVGLILLVVVCVAGAFAASKYLVSKLDGTGGVQAPQTTLQQYSSEEGVTFQYKDTYELSARTEGNGERQWDVLVLLPKGYVPPQGGEGPPTIGLSIFDNPEGLSLDKWITGDARSNWKLAAQDGGLGSTTVGGKSALTYRYSGLYENTAVVVEHNGKIFFFTVGWMDQSDPIRADFDALLETVRFN